MATSNTPAGRFTIEDVRDLQDDLVRMDSDLLRRAHLVQEYPHISANFWKNRVTPSQLIRMDPEVLLRVLQYADPTGEAATRRADREREKKAA